MRRLDAYVLRHYVGAFLFFCLIMVGVIWLVKAVPLIDAIIASGKSILVFLLFSTFVLPLVLKIVMPLACLAGAIYALNKLYTDAELVVMMAAGQGPFSLARPTLIYALFVAGLTLLATLFFDPWAETKMAEEQAAIRSELASAVLVEGRFIHPMDGLSIFIRDTSDAGQMAGLFLHDERVPEQTTTYTATRAVLLRDGDLARLVMSDGIALNYDTDTKILSRVQFDEFTYDLSDLLAQKSQTFRRIGSFTLSELLNPTQEMIDSTWYERGDFVAFGHERLVLAMNAFVMPFLALAIMLTGSYQRKGFGRRITVTILSGVALAATGIAVKSVVIGDPDSWPVFYAAPVLFGLAATLLLWRSSQARSRTPEAVTT